MPDAVEFKNDDDGYRAWLAAHPDGFVLNVRREPTPEYVVLHRASCGTISSEKHLPGAYTARGYRKICAASVEPLQAASRREGRQDGSFSKRCTICGA